MATVDEFSYPPRGMSREEAARYIGIDAAHFDRLIADARMPKPKLIDGRSIWDRFSLDTAFSALASEYVKVECPKTPPAHLLNAYTPATLAKRWLCSERHVRNLCAKGELHPFKAGGKLLRINRQEVEDFEARIVQPKKA